MLLSFPSTAEQWEDFYEFFMRKFYFMDAFDFITKDDVRAIDDFNRAYRNKTNKAGIPAHMTVRIKDLFNRLKAYRKRKVYAMDREMAAIEYLDDRIEDSQNRVYVLIRRIVNGDFPSLEEVTHLKEQYALQTYFAIQVMSEEEVAHRFSLIGVVGEIEDFIMDLLEEVQQERARDIADIGDSPSRSAPISISPDTPDSKSRRYLTSYNRHSKLSAVSVTNTNSQSKSPKSHPISAQTRQEMLQDLRKSCRAMKDYISFENFSKMRKKVLQFVTRVAPDKNKKLSCYTARNLYRLWVNDHKAGIPVRDPVTRVPLTKAELDTLMLNVQGINKKAVDPRKSSGRGYKRLRLEVSESVEELPDGRTHAFYSLRLCMFVHSLSFTVFDLGFVPANMEPSDFTQLGRAVNYSTAVLITHLQELFESRRLLTENTVPYRCCKIHLRKDVAYWHDPSDPTGISQRRFKLMMDEVDQLLSGFIV